MTAQIFSIKNQTEKSAASFFYSHKDKIEQEIARSISSFGEKSKLRDAVEYSLTSGGKRFRPVVVFLIAEALKHELNVSDAALSVEFFHTASLIADDLPCMDDEDERRGKPTVHKVFGETIALLSSYALITAAFERIHKNAEAMKEAGAPFSNFSERACMIALESASRCAGILGATGGQFLDLFPPNHSLDTVKQVIYKKSVTLFEVAFVFGWVFGGGDLSQIEMIKKTSYHLGMAFQIADDITDIESDEKKQHEMNLARLIGKERALYVFEEELNKFRQALIDLKLNTPSFEKLCGMLSKLATNA
ncbi:MAG: polyprenyl synthetase family protein [Chlamydiales bacterium]|nr:polyprenyl synthetase family protein [Chlamydiales bacterium]